MEAGAWRRFRNRRSRTVTTTLETLALFAVIALSMGTSLTLLVREIARGFDGASRQS